MVRPISLFLKKIDISKLALIWCVGLPMLMDAGTSLESLANGAVQFSQRFSVQELQNRRLALLYDSVVSAEASSHMTEFEHSASFLPSKSCRFEDSKEIENVPGKRKAESVRSFYYSMRKRICNEPFDSTDPNFVFGHGHNNCFVNRDALPSANYMLGDSISNHFGLCVSNGLADACYARFCNPIEEDLYIVYNEAYKQIPRSLGENVPLATSCSVVEELGQPKEVPISNPFEAHHLDAKPLVISDQNTGNGINLWSGFGESKATDSPISGCDALLHNLGYTSPLSPMPIWKTIDGVSVSTFAFQEHGNLESTNSPGYDLHCLDSRHKNQIPCDNTENSIPSPNEYLADLSDTLLNFTNEEELLFRNADGKDGIDKSYIDGLSSLLFDSPDNYLDISVGEHCGESVDEGRSCGGGGGRAVCSSLSQTLPCSSYRNLQFPELHGVICCSLNTEDTEIPNNDVFLPNQMPSSTLSSVTHLIHEASDFEWAKHLNYNNADSSLEKQPAPGFDSLMSYPQANAISTKQEVDALATIRNQHSLHAEFSSVEMTIPELVVNSSSGDQEELPSDIDGDVPHFSDVEAMVEIYNIGC
ncbi:hypothetical protein U1Q18_005895 [Sarracenia purpurea var. burkii]